jgi:transcriptional regulator with XRE-family HTH domain
MLGDVLRAARLRHGWTQEQVARRIGATQGMITALERGKARRPHARRMAPLAEALGLPVEELERAAGPRRHR